MRRIIFAAALAVVGGLGAVTGSARAAEFVPADSAGIIRTGGDLERGGYDDYCYRYPYRCRERWRDDDERRYWDGGRERRWREGQERRWRWQEWERRRAWWWRNEGRREFCWRHPDHWRCYPQDHH